MSVFDTFEEAKKASIWRWKNFQTGHPEFEDWEKSEFDVHGEEPMHNCGFCDYYDENCQACPLYWEDAHEEPRSSFDAEDSLPCAREFWHWAYYYDNRIFLSNANRMMRYWANRLLKRIEEAEDI